MAFSDDPEFRRRYLAEGHRCERVATFQDPWTWWVGKLLAEFPGFPGETHCLHIETPLKKVVFLLDGEYDAGLLTVIGAFIAGHSFNEEWVRHYVGLARAGRVAFGRKVWCASCDDIFDRDADFEMERHVGHDIVGLVPEKV